MRDGQKKPVVYLLVILPILAGGGILLIIGLETAYARMAAVPLTSVPNLNALLISLPAFLLWIPVTLLLANRVLFAVPSLRRVADAYVERSTHSGFADSQRQLGKIALIMALFCLPLILLGFIL